MHFSQQNRAFLPARLVKAKQAWYIVFYQTHPHTGIRIRHRKKLGINLIKDKRHRELYARQLIQEINLKLPLGYPYEMEQKLTVHLLPVGQALEKALRIKNMSEREKTRSTYKSVVGVFQDYLRTHQLQELPISHFDGLHALRFMDYLLEQRGLANRTYNNYKVFMSSLFNELVKRKYLVENPFKAIRKRAVHGKERRAFSAAEKTLIGHRIYENDKWLFLAVVLQYYCFIRPSSELRRLRRWHFDLVQGIISMPGSITKNGKEGIVTIPDLILPFVREQLQRIPGNHLIFGKGVRPHPSIACGRNTLHYRHKQILQELHRKGLLKDIQGLTFYSWKDTGALELFRQKVNILEIMRQLRHTDLSTTQRYCNSLYIVNKEIKELRADPFNLMQ